MKTLIVNIRKYHYYKISKV